MNNKRFHIIIATTLFAALLWVSVSMRENYQVQISAPLVIEAVPAGKAISSPIPRAVQLTFDDIGWKLAKLLWRAELKWVLDLNTFPPTHHTLTLNDFAGQIGFKLGVQPTSMKPESFSIAFDTVASKKIAIIPSVSLTFREGYGQVGKPIVEPESVLVSGARSLLKTINAWHTARQTFEQLRQPVDMIVSLADTLSHVLTFTPNQVNLRINIQQFAEKIFTGIPIEMLSVPPNREVILSSPRVDIVLRGGIQQLGSLTQNSIRATVDYRAILADTSGIIEPEITMPSNVQIVKRTPERLQYVVRKKY